jgi:putative membrane protein
MARRLWNIITVPAFVLMTVFGIWMLYLRSDLLIINDSLPWFYVKIIFLIGLFIYHYWCWKKVLEIKNLNGKELPTANLKLRQSNEIATFLLFLVVFVAILKSRIRILVAINCRIFRYSVCYYDDGKIGE